MNPQISARAFEKAIECGLLKRGPDDDRALCLITPDVADFALATQPMEWQKLEQHLADLPIDEQRDFRGQLTDYVRLAAGRQITHDDSFGYTVGQGIQVHSALIGRAGGLCPSAGRRAFPGDPPHLIGGTAHVRSNEHRQTPPRASRLA